MNWIVPKIWEGGDVWIIGGGPSLTKQFDIPNDVVQRVLAGNAPPSVYSPYMSYLHDKHVIGINVAFLIGDWIDMVFFGDMGFFLKYKHMLAQFPGIKVSCNPETAKHPWVKTMTRDTKWSKGIASTPGKVSWNNNSGSAAITVAAQAGAKRIYLLGFDMGLNGHEQQHWHDIYHHMGGKNPKKPHLLPFDRHLAGFPFIAKDAASWGIEIINVCPDSRITQFPKVSLKEVINERN